MPTEEVPVERAERLRFGVRIPSYAWSDATYDDADHLRGYCRRVEELPFDGIWVIDHLLVSPALYGVSWLDPLMTLTFAAAVTDRVSVGPAALVLPLRQPVLLAKELATLQHLSKGRLILGIATGWDEKEFDSVGVSLRERGGRTDEALALILRLLSEQDVSFEGKFFSAHGISIEPPIASAPPVWVAGGSLVRAEETPDTSYIAPSVLRRILRADGWISRSSGSDASSVKKDWEEINRFLSHNDRDPETLVFAQTQFVHIVETNSRRVALAEQLPHFRRVMGTHRSDDDLTASYLVGTVDEIQREIDDLVQVGMDYLMLTPLVSSSKQLDLLVTHAVEPLSK